MNNKKKLVLPVLAAAFVLLLAGAWVLYDRLSGGMEPSLSVTEPEESGTVSQAPEESVPPTETPEPSESESQEPARAPDFTVYDGAGNPVKLSDFVGTPVVVNFWASWCGPCKSEMPEFDAACARYAGQVEFLMVNLTDGARETVETATSFIQELGYSFPVYFDTDSSAAIAYGTYSIPATYFIDGEGHAVAYGVGALSAAALEKGIGMILPQ